MLWQIQRNFSHSAVVSTSQPWPKSLGKPQKSVIESYPRSRSIDSSKLNHFCFTWKLEYGFVRDFILTFSIFAFPCISSHSDWNEPGSANISHFSGGTYQLTCSETCTSRSAEVGSDGLSAFCRPTWTIPMMTRVFWRLRDWALRHWLLCKNSIHRVHLGLSQIRTRNH